MDRIAPTLGALIGRAAALGEARGPETGWAQLQALPAEKVAQHQPYWAVAAPRHRQMNRLEESEAAYARAIGLRTDPAIRAYLIEQARAAAAREKI